MQENQDQKLNPQAIRILDILEGHDTLGNGWHCPIEWGYADGHAKRITDIGRFLAPKGFEVLSDWCDCGRHTAKVMKRKIILRGGAAVAHRPHNPVYAGSNPAPATKFHKSEWVFESEKDPKKKYHVIDFTTCLICDCPGYEYRKTCKHVECVKQMIKQPETVSQEPNKLF